MNTRKDRQKQHYLKYSKSTKGRLARKRAKKKYRQSLKGKLEHNRHYSTPYGLNKRRVYQAKRRGSILILDHIDRKVLLDMYDNSCAYCGCSLGDDRGTHIDHLIPIARYKAIGRICPHSYATVAPACATCNTRKGTLTPLEFFYNKF